MDFKEQEINPNLHEAAINGYKVWPFDATRLFYTKLEEERARSDESHRMKGIFSYKHACGFVYDFADKVVRKTKRCVSAIIIQQGDAPDEGSETDPANGNRIDIELLKDVGESQHCYPLCGNANCTDCNAMEKKVAKAVLGLHRNMIDGTAISDIIRDVLKNAPQKPESTESNCANCKPPYVEKCESDGQPYFKYNCPRTLVGGIMMPIIVNDIVIAAVIVGQFIWDDYHKADIFKTNVKDNADPSEYLKEVDKCDPSNNEKIIKILAEEVSDFENRLKNRLDRNAFSLFSRVIDRVHSDFSKFHNDPQGNIEREFRAAVEATLDYLKKTLSFEQVMFFPQSIFEQDEDEWLEPYGKSSVISPNATAIKKEQIIKFVAKRGNDAVYLTNSAPLQYSLHLFDDAKEISRLSFVLKYSGGRLITPNEWEVFCYHMEPVMRELNTQCWLALREEEHDQYFVTMRQFTHELGKKSHSGKACSLILQRQIENLKTDFSPFLRDSQIGRTVFRESIEKLERTAEDMEYIFDGIEFLSDIARAKANGLQSNPERFNVRFEVLNALAAQYRIDIRGRGMKIVYREALNGTDRLFGDIQLVHIAIHNLVSNAIKYGYPGTMIYYSCYKGFDDNGRSGVYIDVIDYGTHIPPDKREAIFLDNTRLGEARSDSMGFGLYLTREIMRRHGGTCKVAESEIISPFALPYLEEMLKLENSILRGLKMPDMDEIRNELARVRANGLYNEVVNRPIRVSKEREPIIMPRRLFIEGTRPMAKTTMRLFFPEDEK